ncbi:MAG: hypothetical protein V1821_03465 [bacterium]
MQEFLRKRPKPTPKVAPKPPEPPKAPTLFETVEAEVQARFPERANDIMEALGPFCLETWDLAPPRYVSDLGIELLPFSPSFYDGALHNADWAAHVQQTLIKKKKTPGLKDPQVRAYFASLRRDHVGAEPTRFEKFQETLEVVDGQLFRNAEAVCRLFSLHLLQVLTETVAVRYRLIGPEAVAEINRNVAVAVKWLIVGIVTNNVSLTSEFTSDLNHAAWGNFPVAVVDGWKVYLCAPDPHRRD